MLKRFVTALALAALLRSATLAVAPSVQAGVTPPPTKSEAAAICQEAAAEGILAQLGLTVGECVNFVSGPASEQSNNFIAALCGLNGIYDDIEEELGVTVTNKGQCIKVLRDFFSQG